MILPRYSYPLAECRSLGTPLGLTVGRLLENHPESAGGRSPLDPGAERGIRSRDITSRRSDSQQPSRGFYSLRGQMIRCMAAMLLDPMEGTSLGGSRRSAEEEQEEPDMGERARNNSPHALM